MSPIQFGTLLLLAAFSSLVAVAKSTCTISLQKDIPDKEPILIVAKPFGYTDSLLKPNGPVVTLPIGTRLTLECTGKNNFIKNINTPTATLVCSPNQDWITFFGQSLKLKDLGCNIAPATTLRVTKNSCASGLGTIFETGFELSNGQFFKSFEICHDSQLERTYYTQSVINGAAINSAIRNNTRPAFSAKGLPYTTAYVKELYSIENQTERFNEYFNNAQTYISRTMFLARGHLSPDADFIFSYEQASTYYYANVAPEFQCINSGNWVSVEKLVRKKAGSLQRDLLTINGYIDVLSLNDKNANPVDIYLDRNQKFPAAKWFFKVIKDEKTDSAMVFITYNNPFATNVQLICPDICAAAGYAKPAFSDFRRGYTYCCTLDTFKNYYTHLPANLRATNVLVA